MKPLLIILLFIIACSLAFKFCKLSNSIQINEAFPKVIVDSSFVIPEKSNVNVDNGYIENGILKLKINYLGGCKKHYFSLISNGNFTKTNPGQVYLYLSDGVNDDKCKQIVKENLSFDISKLRHPAQNNINFIIADTLIFKYTY